MNRHQTLRASSRANWFAELSDALDEGDRILADLIAEGFSPDETERLRLRLAVLRAELRRLNRVGLAEDRIVGQWPEAPIRHAEPVRSLHPDWQSRRD